MRLNVKKLLFLTGFNATRIFRTHLIKIPVTISRKPVQWQQSCCMQTDRQTDRQTEGKIEKKI
jgi:hypothetical protein